ncbi:MAG: UMP kinase [Gammaproteobacteria bacterium]|nr:UMP kinase [Gammaproteobacteria bacterium]MDE0302429.1 UMP kinase [Gammaproteobacteria bacterium]
MSAAYRRILLKLSGEALMGANRYGIDPDTVRQLASALAGAQAQGVQIAVVVGGGNIVRGEGLEAAGIDRVTGDQMGMLATLINALALQESVEQNQVPCRVMSAIPVPQVCESYIRRRAVRHLEKGRLVVFATGTGNPFFTTDSAASLRAVEIGADILLKATKVDGVYSSDPFTDKDAQRFDVIDYDEALHRKLGIMDSTALVLCRDNRIPIRVFDMFEEGALMRLLAGEPVGTLVHAEGAHA